MHERDGFGIRIQMSKSKDQPGQQQRCGEYGGNREGCSLRAARAEEGNQCDEQWVLEHGFEQEGRERCSKEAT